MNNHGRGAPALGPGAPARPIRFGEGAPIDVDPSLIPDDAPVDASAIVADSKIREVLDDLDRGLIGLTEVKARIREISALLMVDRLRTTLGLVSDSPTLHMCFTGNPGTGKTTVAMQMGRILHQLGYVRKGHLLSVSREDLVGQYVGHTAPKTREAIKRAMGGVLFIDEAYHLYRLDNERDYGQETVELLLQAMENDRHDLVVIMAGYKDRMERFFGDVPGISSRIAHHIDFPDYSVAELSAIAKLMLADQGYRLSEDAEEAFSGYLGLRVSQPNFANGRSVRNAIDRARMRQAVRIYDSAEDGRPLTKRDLLTIEAEDITKSRVFQGGLAAN